MTLVSLSTLFASFSMSATISPLPKSLCISMLSFPLVLSTAFYISQYPALAQLPSDCFIAHVTSLSTDLRNPICALTSILLPLLVRMYFRIQISRNTLSIPHKAATWHHFTCLCRTTLGTVYFIYRYVCITFSPSHCSTFVLNPATFNDFCFI